ncbi:MAG: hypothetical protein GY800_09135 [Planctomycetes bacterium]|nr:hypothetical protein [Planctomycetota bacterium]
MMAILKGLPFDEYRKLEGVNKSTLDLINKAPGLVQWMRDCPEDTAKKNAGIFGNAFHTLVLEPEKFEKKYIVAPKIDKRTKAGKEEYQEFSSQSKGKIILDQEEMHQLKLMQGSVMAHPEARKLIELAETEVTFHCDRGSYSTKSRHDGFIQKSMVSFDLKTIDPGNKELTEAWGATVEKRRYDVQAAHYNEDVIFEFGNNLKAFYFIVVSKSLSMGRYECRVMRLGLEQYEQGLEDRNKDMKKYLKCMDSERWPGIETTITPAYAKRGY